MWWLLLADIAAAGPKADARRAEREDPFSQLNLDRAMHDIVPLVEAAAGRPFLTPPVLELSSEVVFQKMLSEEQRLIFDAVMKETPPEVRQKMAEAAGDVTSQGLLGKYGIFEDTLFLCPDAIVAAATHAELPTHRVGEFVRLVLAHELTHALHDQYVDLAEQVRGLDDRDALWAATATWEGLATWVEGQVSHELDLADAHALLIGLQGWSERGLEETRAYPVWAVYGRGQQTMAWHFERGSYDQVWQVAARPPRRSSGVFRPESWPAEPPPSPIDYAEILRGAEQLLTRGEWLVGVTTLGEFALRGEAILGHKEADLEPVLAHLTQAWSLDASRPDRSAEIRILQFDDPAWPGAYLDLLRAQQTEDARVTAAMTGREVEVRHEPFEEVPGDDAMLRISRVQGVGGTFLERQSAWVVRGSTVVVVSTQDFRPGLRLGWTVASVFRRLDAARAGEPLPDHGKP